MERNSVKKPLVLSVANYTENPGPRYIRQGDSSGEDFYLSILNKAFVECIQKDLMLMRLLLHDGLKLGKEESKYTKFEHPILKANYIEDCKSKFCIVPR